LLPSSLLFNPTTVTKTQLIIEIEAYAAAKATGNQVLIVRSGTTLNDLLSKLPEELLPEKQVDSLN